MLQFEILVFIDYNVLQYPNIIQEDRLSIIVFFILSVKNSSKNCDNEVASKATHRQQAHPDRMKKLKRPISVLQVSLSIIDINPQYK